MIQPIRLYGDPVLRQPAQAVSGPGDALDALLTDLLETLEAARGIGLAAPQIGRSERVFVVDLTLATEELDRSVRWKLPPQPMEFVNPRITWESEEGNHFEEGCLSLPDVRDDVVRSERIRIVYRNREFTRKTLMVDDLLARVILHEYDHLEGVLFIDHLSPFRRKLLRRRIRAVMRGEVETDYQVAAYQAAGTVS